MLAPKAEEAAVVDLALLRDLQSYHNVNPTISAATVAVLRRQTWYLGTDLVGLAVFTFRPLQTKTTSQQK